MPGWRRVVPREHRLTVRRLAGHPWSSAAVVLTLGFGIGITVAAFTVLNGALLRPLEYRHQERLLSIAEVEPPAIAGFRVTPAAFLRWRERSRTLENMVVYYPRIFYLATRGQAEMLRGAEVSPGFFDTLTNAPLVGRTFSDTDHHADAASVVVLSRGLARQLFGGEAGLDQVSSGYLEAIGIPLLAGRDFAGSDDSGSPPVAIVRQELARRLVGSASPLGLQIRVSDEEPLRTVVGVAGDIRFGSLRDSPEPRLYQSYRQSPSQWMELVVRGAPDPLLLEQAIRDALRSVDPRQPLKFVGPLSGKVRDSLDADRYRALLLTLMAAVAMAIAMLGAAAATASAVSRRTFEIGIRRAVGAGPQEVVRLLVADSMRWSLLGGVLGGAAAVAGARLLRAYLFEVAPADPLTLAATLLVLLLATGIAAYLPARRAARLDPNQVLR